MKPENSKIIGVRFKSILLKKIEQFVQKSNRSGRPTTRNKVINQAALDFILAQSRK